MFRNSICILSFFFLSMVQLNRPSFSGIWKLNIEKSKFGNVPTYAAVQQFDITQKENAITIKRINLSKDSVVTTSKETIPLDGKTYSYTMDNRKTKSSAISWSPDEQTMTTVSTYSKPDQPTEIEYQLTQDWSLQIDGKELKVLLKTPGYMIEAVYDKQ